MILATGLIIARQRAHAFTIPLASRVSLRIQTFRPMSSATFSSIDEVQLLKDMLHRVRAINDVPEEIRDVVLDFTVDGISLGKVRELVANGDFHSSARIFD